MSKNKDIINWYDVIDKKYLTTSVNPNYDDYKEFTGHKIKFPLESKFNALAPTRASPEFGA